MQCSSVGFPVGTLRTLCSGWELTRLSCLRMPPLGPSAGSRPPTALAACTCLKPTVGRQEATSILSSVLSETPSDQTVSPYLLTHPAFLKHPQHAWHCHTGATHVPTTKHPRVTKRVLWETGRNNQGQYPGFWTQVS